MRLKVHCFHLTGMLAAWMVMPLSRSAGKKSVVVLPVSTDPGAEINEDVSRIDSVNVVLPESRTTLSNRLKRTEAICTYMSHKRDITCVAGVKVIMAPTVDISGEYSRMNL